jgi:hypothetical protein
MLQVNVDLLSNEPPLYKVTFQNRSTQPISAIAYRAYRGEADVLHGRRRSNRSLPVLQAGGRLEFTIGADRSSKPQGFDRLEVTGVLWEDGSLDGDSTLKTDEQALAIGYAYQLRRVLTLLREHDRASISEIRTALEMLPVELSSSELKALDGPSNAGITPSGVEMGQLQVRIAVLEDLEGYMQSQHATSNTPAAVWVQDALTRYSAWLVRAVTK